MKALLLSLFVVGAEHGLVTVCPERADTVILERLGLGSLWYPVAFEPCEPGDTVRFDVAKYFRKSLWPGQTRTYRALAGNRYGLSAPTPAVTLEYPGGVWYIRLTGPAPGPMF